MQGILFDLDGTLLDIDLRSFIGRYFIALSNAMRRIGPQHGTGESLMRAVHEATEAMMLPHPGTTNQERFNQEFERLTGVDLNEYRDVFDQFYDEEFPALRDGYGPMRGAHTALQTSRELGLRIAVATNPLFPRRAVEHRLAWAGLDGFEFDVVTSYETMHACKPYAEYFRQTAEALGVEPTSCLMVGDDRVLDLPASDVGMKTYYVGTDPDAPADYRGDLETLAITLPFLIERR
ncbi:MAG: HAD family hydrolase [Clostridiales bacterium]|nr:HAD family hydrolase [Clostridiales bacterium]